MAEIQAPPAQSSDLLRKLTTNTPVQRPDTQQQSSPTPEQKPEVKSEVKTVVSETPVVKDDRKTEPVVAQAVVETKPETKEVKPDSLDSLFQKPADVSAPIPEDVKSFFKSRFGTDDVEGFQKEHLTVKEQVSVLKEKADLGDRINQVWDGLPPDIKKAVEMIREGKDGVDWLRSIPKTDYSKPAAQLDKFELTFKRFGDKFSPEEREELRGSAPDEALKLKFDRYHDISSVEHDGLRTKWTEENLQKEQATSQFNEKWQRNAAESEAYLKQNYPSLELELTPQLLADHRSGKLYSDLYFDKNGLRKPEALANAIKTMKVDAIIARATAAAQLHGETKGGLEAQALLPDTQRPSGGENPTPKTQEPSVEKRILASIK